MQHASRAERAVRGQQAHSAGLLLTAHLRANLANTRPLAPTNAAGRHPAPKSRGKVSFSAGLRMQTGGGLKARQHQDRAPRALAQPEGWVNSPPTFA